MADQNAPNAPAAGDTSKTDLARAAAAGPRVDEPDKTIAKKNETAWFDAAHADLESWFDTHVKNSKLAQRTDLYNAAHGFKTSLKELFGQVAS